MSALGRSTGGMVPSTKSGAFAAKHQHPMAVVVPSFNADAEKGFDLKIFIKRHVGRWFLWAQKKG